MYSGLYWWIVKLVKQEEADIYAKDKDTNKLKQVS